MKNFKFGLFNTELTEIKNGWLVTERTIPLLGMELGTTTYYSTLTQAVGYLIRKEKAAKKRAEKEKKRKKVRK